MTGTIIAYRLPGATKTRHFGPCNDFTKHIFLEEARWTKIQVLYLVSIRPKPPMPICLDEGGGP